ncbi:MAG: arsenate reductase (glutaredoxin) [Iamia sp.]
MSDTVLWHNARCSKSREAKALLEEAEVDTEIREYLKEPPTRDELEALLRALAIDDPREVMRTSEDAYDQLGLSDAGHDELLDAVVANPILLERPILVRGDQAVVGRPPEDIKTLL